MIISRKLYRKTGYFLKEITRSKIIIQAILTGLIAGILVVLFKISITKTFNIIQNYIQPFCFSKKMLIFPLITTLGGLISGLLVCKIAPETKGSGIPYVKMAMARMGNVTRIRSIFVKFFAGIAGIGTGLSLGREGPSVQLGSGAGALVGKFFKMKGTDKDKLIASGAGAGIAATFNAPIAGTLFVLEELVNKFSPALLFPVLIATVTAASIARYFLGINPSFKIPVLSPYVSIQTIFVCIILGLIAGFLGVAFAKVIFLNNKLYDKLYKIPDWFKPAIAGLITGIVGLYIPFVLGSGNSAVDMLLANKFTFLTILVIFIAKFFITPLCFGSGAAGGIFLPMLMLGSFLGYLTGLGAEYFGLCINPTAMALIGMGAFLSAVARTPITAVVMVFEMTGGYSHILPIMLSAAIADLVAEKLGHKPIYSLLIVNQSIKSGEAKLLYNLKVKNFMSYNTESVNTTLTLQEVFEKFNTTEHKAFPILNKKSELVGIVTKSNIEDALFQGNKPNTTLEKIMNPQPTTILPDENLYLAYYRLHTNNTEWLVVTDRRNRVKGIITRHDIQNAVEQHSQKN